MKSMTGFGSAAGEARDMTISVEVRSVNHRFFSMRMNLPEELSIYEPVIERMVRAKVSRGTVNLSVSIASSNGGEGPEIREELFKKIFRRFSSLKRATGSKDPLSFEALLGLPFLWQQTNHSTARVRNAWPRIKRLIDEALKALMKMRDEEGRAIREDLAARVSVIEECVTRIAARAPMVETFHREKILKKLSDLVKQVDAGNSVEAMFKDIAQSVDKSDIAEEIQRLSHHAQQFRRTLESRGKVGRRLDFLTQEMVRETNTIASKAADPDIIDQTIEIKSQLERIKEQVENVE